MLKLKTVLEKISKDDLYDYYIKKDHSYYDTINHFGLTDWMFNKVLKYYDVKKDKSESCKKGVQTKYNKAGGRENYNRQLLEKRKQTYIKKYGSIEAYNAFISNKCSNTWNLKSDIEKKEHAALVMKHGGGWNKDTIRQTLKDKYNVDNAYKLATTFNCNSKVNAQFADLLKANKINYSREFQLNNYRYDFKVDNTLVEIDPWPFHNTSWNPISDKCIDKNYHKDKTNNAVMNNYRCIHVFDWEDKNKIIDLLKPRDTIYARKCEIKEVDKEEAKAFILKHHLQGYSNDNIRIGLYYNNMLVSIMTFGKPRYNKKYQYELIRYCSSKNVVGGAERLFNYFLTAYNPKSIISYCDYSKFNGNVYTKLGFKLLRKSQPSKHWYNIKTHRHITDNLLRQKGFDKLFGTDYGKGTPNESLMLEAYFVEIYDCGQGTYVWNI